MSTVRARLSTKKQQNEKCHLQPEWFDEFSNWLKYNIENRLHFVCVAILRDSMFVRNALEVNLSLLGGKRQISKAYKRPYECSQSCLEQMSSFN